MTGSIEKLKNLEDYYSLLFYQQNYPELTFDNNGYEYLKAEIQESHKVIIDKISKILKRQVKGFSRFDNFKPRKDKNTFDVRCQYYWDIGFCGVGYFNIKEFKNYGKN